MAQPTTAEQRARLAAAGYVRFDGLTAYFPPGDSRGKYVVYVVKAGTEDLGRFDGNNGVTVIVTTGTEVWLAVAGGPPERLRQMEELWVELCPHGQGAFVPCSHGERVCSADLLRRLADPDWQPIV